MRCIDFPQMEVIFSSIKKDSGSNRGLRSYGLEHWSSVVATLNGSILLNNELEDFDSYLISESSLFVYSDRVIILTCGTTTLLKALPSIIESARKM
jgi:S-adenosylmethionine decarboxylase